VTSLGIVNPNRKDIELTLELFLRSGNLVESVSRIVRAEGSMFEAVSSLFNLPASLDNGYVMASTVDGKDILGTEMVDLNDGKSLIVLNAATSNPQMEAFSAQLAAGPGVFTQINLVNTSSSNRHVQLSVLAENGTRIAGPVDLEMTAGGQAIEDASDFFSFPSGSLSVGSLMVSADGNGIIGDVVFGEPDNLDYAAALPLQTERATRMIFCQVADSNEFFTGLAFFNPNQEDSSITIRVYSNEGGLTGSTSFNLGAGKRTSRFLREFIPASAGQVGGYVVVDSTLPLVGQELFGGQNSEFLSAVPPHIVRVN